MVREHQWDQYFGKHVVLGCSVDAIIPSWAYMILVSKLTGIASTIHYGNQFDIEQAVIRGSIEKLDSETYVNSKIVIKGCGDLKLRDLAFIEITKKLAPVVSSIMYGEPCSTVPVYKKKR